MTPRSSSTPGAPRKPRRAAIRDRTRRLFVSIVCAPHEPRVSPAVRRREPAAGRDEQQTGRWGASRAQSECTENDPGRDGGAATDRPPPSPSAAHSPVC